MSLTKQSAWTIFKAVSLGQPEGEQAISRMRKPEFEAYECLREDFEMELAKVGVAAQNEAAALNEANAELIGTLQAKRPYLWTAADYRSMVSLFEGSKYEQLHLSAAFRLDNRALLLELAKPES